MPRPVLFLDVDGVLHPLTPSGHAKLASLEALCARADAEADLPDDAIASVVEGEFIDECMTALASCVQATNARIVLSSTWRETWPQRRAVEAQLEKYGLSISDATPMLPLVDGGRAMEIRRWISSSTECRWCAVDDQDLKLPLDNFVQTDPAVGLTMADAALLIERLGSWGHAH